MLFICQILDHLGNLLGQGTEIEFFIRKNLRGISENDATTKTESEKQNSSIRSSNGGLAQVELRTNKKEVSYVQKMFSYKH